MTGYVLSADADLDLDEIRVAAPAVAH